MKNDGLINHAEIRKAIATLKPDGEVFEIRIPGKGISGYFRDAERLITAFDTVDLRGENVYITVNRVKPELLSRAASERFKKTKEATSDKDIDGFDWLFVDFDPERTSGISATADEIKKAFDLARRVRDYLSGIGFEEPLKAFSGNGVHLLYKIGLLNTDENIQLISDCLKSLDMMFSTDSVHIDIVNFNPSRICKLYGTLAQKGANTEDRPHRMSHIIGDPGELKQTPKVYLEKLAAAVPHEEIKPHQYNNYTPSTFDIRDWMAKHGIRYKERKYKDGTKYVLDECPFNSNHRAPDSAIFELNSGAIGFKCLHNSCAGRTWQDVRVLFEPTAYEQQINDRDRQIEEGWRRHNAERQKIIYRPMTEETPESPMFQTAEMILSKPEKRREFVKTGITMIDRNLMGLEKGCVSLVSGLRGSAKSTLLGEITLSAIDAGSTVLVYSGELTDTNYMRWLYLQAAGKNHVVQSAEHARFFYVPDEVKKQIAGWMGSRLWLYNNEHGNNFQRILIALTAKAQESRADLIILDNLMALELDGANTDKYEAQKRFIWSLESLAKLSNTHIVFVAHPRKAMGFLRLDDVSGSGDLSNAVDNAFIIHRNNHDFQKFTRQEFGWKPTDDIYTSTNVIEICKNRDLGAQDEFIPLWFEESTKRLKNELTEYKHFGWEENIEFI